MTALDWLWTLMVADALVLGFTLGICVCRMRVDYTNPRNRFLF